MKAKDLIGKKRAAQKRFDLLVRFNGGALVGMYHDDSLQEYAEQWASRAGCVVPPRITSRREESGRFTIYNAETMHALCVVCVVNEGVRS